MFVFLVCLVLAACHCEASGYIGSGIYGIDGSGLYNNYDGAYAASYRNYKPYAFEYGVSDPYTGDHKSQWETKDQHGTVRGSYSLLEPDGSTRIVDYIADDNGFRAIVKKIGIHGHPLSVESHGGAESGHSLLQNPIVVAEPSLPAPAPALPLPQPALHVPAPVLAPTPIPVPTHVPITPQFVVNNQEAVVRQPAVYIEEGPVFQSYDGGIRNYQNLIPVPKAQGVYSQQPVFQAAPEINLQQSYVQQPVLAPTAAGISQGGYVIPQERYPDSYQQQVYQAPAEVRTYQNVPSYPVNQAGVSYDQRLPEVTYHAPIEQSRVSVPEYPAYEDRRTYSEPIQSNQIAPPASDVGGPVSSYQFEQTFGDPGNLVATQPKYYGQPESISSQNYVGSTGNIQDDREYVNYDISYEDQGYKQPLPYRSKRDSDK